jgi:ribosome-associated protein
MIAGKVDYADFLVVMTGRSDRHVYAIAMGGLEGREGNLARSPSGGLTASTWVLIDFGDASSSTSSRKRRARSYDIENLWISADRLSVPQQSREAGPAASSPHWAPAIGWGMRLVVVAVGA